MSNQSGPNTELGGVLYIVSTPIGNLADISLRALETLKSVAVIAAEDTRHSRSLLDHYGIRTPAIAYHEHNEARETPRLVSRLASGDSIALISDAGTPLLSDPGSRLVRACVEANVTVVPIPGASALLAALVASGISAEQFTFLGFLERKGKDRGHALDAIVNSRITCILYESPNRVRQTLLDLAARGAGDRPVVVARELTKMFETLHRGTVSEVESRLGETVRGEVVIVIAGAALVVMDEDTLRAKSAELLEQGKSSREVVSYLVDALGAPRNLAYRIAHEGR